MIAPLWKEVKKGLVYRGKFYWLHNFLALFWAIALNKALCSGGRGFGERVPEGGRRKPPELKIPAARHVKKWVEYADEKENYRQRLETAFQRICSGAAFHGCAFPRISAIE